MSEPNRCPRCGGSLAPGTAPEACPKCLIGIGLEKTEPGGETRTSHGMPRWHAPAPDEIAADFPQLEILEVLGQGGMGVVYKARQKSLDRMVALKILAVPSDAGPAFAERFAREARALASLSHPSIVTVYDFGSSSGAVFPSVTYRFTESFSAGIGLGFFFGRTQIVDMPQRAFGPAGNRAGGVSGYHDGVDNMLSLLRDKDEVWLKLRWTF